MKDSYTVGYTLVKNTSIVYIWNIQQISSFIESSNTADELLILTSPKFSTKITTENLWLLELYLYDIKSEHNDKVGLYLRSLNRDQEIRAKCVFFVINNEKKKVKKVEFARTFEKRNLNLSWGYTNFLLKKNILDKKDGLSPYDTLTVGVELTVFDEPVTTSQNVPLKKSKALMAQDYENLYKSKVGTDLTIFVGDKQFQVHKVPLIARSPVFCTMLTSDMKEKKENAITIEDVDPEVLKSMLQFIYTDEVTDLDQVAEGLLEVAEKYQISTLKEICSEALCKAVTIDNAARLLILADLHNAKDMLEYIAGFIVTNAANVMKTEECKVMLKTHPSLGSILFAKIATPLES